MTSTKRRVREVYPEAGAHREPRSGGFSVNTMPRGYGAELGFGPTRAAAWKDAASRLPTTSTGSTK